MRNFILSILLFLFIGTIETLPAQEQINGFIPSESKFLILSKADELDLGSYKLFMDGNMRPSAYNSQFFIALMPKDSLEEPVYEKTPFKVKLDKIIYSRSGKLFVKSEQSIYEITKEGEKLIMKMPDKNFSIYPANNNAIYIIINESNSNSIFLFDLNTLVSIKLLTFPQTINEFCGNGKIAFIVSKNKIYQLSGRDIKIIHSSDSDIIAATASNAGIFYSTDTGVYFLNAERNALQFLNLGARSLLFGNNYLYILLNNGTFVIISNINRFKEYIPDNNDRKQ